MASPREENVYMAKLAEQAERYEEMVDFMEKVVDDAEELSVEERNLLSIAYKNVIGAPPGRSFPLSCRRRRAAVMRATSQPSKAVWDGILKLLDTKLIGSASSGDSKLFYLKMEG